jgi:hypothetical protein
MAKKEKEKIHVCDPKETRTWIKDNDIDLLCRAWEKFSGPTGEFESAVGAFVVGRLVGLDGLKVLHNWRTLRKYEDLLGISFKEVLPARTKDTRRINGIRYAERFDQFWKAIAGGVASEPDAKLAVTA